MQLELETESSASIGITRERDGDMTAEECRGREILTFFILLILLTDLATGLFAVAMAGASILPRAIRVIVGVFLFSALYCGSLVAKRISIVLFGLGSLVGLAMIVIKRDGFVTVLTGCLVLLFVTFIVVLENSSTVNAFMAYQRRKRAVPGSPPVPPETPPATSG